MRVLLESPHGQARFDGALGWLLAQEASQPLLLIAPSLEAASDLMRRAALEKGSVFGWYRESLASLAARLSALPLAAEGLALAGPLALEALAVRVVAELRAAGKLGRLERVQDRPGLPRALARTFDDLAMAGLSPEAVPGELGEAYAFHRELLARERLADRATLYRAAIRAVSVSNARPIGERTLFYDVASRALLERQLIEHLVARAPECYATLPSGDALSRRAFRDFETVGHAAGRAPQCALERLQAQLFTKGVDAAPVDESLTVLSAPGEARECVEIARLVLAEAERGTRFDRMAILLRSPLQYRVHLIEALRRAGIPASFSRAVERPDPSGRALLALLTCAEEGLSASRFAEYLSLGVVPAEDNDKSERRQGGRATNQRWEALLVDAAVVGGLPRWERRLAGLARRLELHIADVSEDDDVKKAALERKLADLAELRAFALPLVAELAALPAQALWGEWLDRLSALAERAVRDPSPILTVLAELAPLRPIGPVGLSEVLLVLRDWLGEVSTPRTPSGGALTVASIDDARGRVFDVVFIPGLAEKLFPQRVTEDPLLPDEVRRSLSRELLLQPERVGLERLALELAVGAARRSVVVTYPRFESQKARPRVPSFYALEVLRAAEGKLPSFAELARRADLASQTRMGWPAPKDPSRAIDAAEYDLSVLALLLRDHDPGESGKSQGSQAREGRVRYLLDANARLARALRFRARRWHKKWSNADGLVELGPEGRAALEARVAVLQARGFSVTGLEKYSSCPYRFYLAQIVGLSPRDTAEAVEEIDPVTRGVLVHEVLRSVGSELRAQGRLPVTREHLEPARALLDKIFFETVARFRDDLAPAIDRVWEDGVRAVRTDLQRWLFRAAEGDGWTPTHFELGFGFRNRDSDPESRTDPVTLENGLSVRGAIDLVEQSGGRLRATDYKTGAAKKPGLVLDGGKFLQPVFYALALERLFPSQGVEGGRAYYCTEHGDFTALPVPLDDTARASAERFREILVQALKTGFLPAAPDKDACQYCDFQRVCGPYESVRVSKKLEKSRLEPLLELRRMP